MAKSSSIQKNKSRHKLIDKFSEKRKLLKSKVMDKSLSLEDRIIKHFVHKEIKPCNLPHGLPILDKDLNKNIKWQWVIKKQRADDLELNSNPRSRSATLRAIKKL